MNDHNDSLHNQQGSKMIVDMNKHLETNNFLSPSSNQHNLGSDLMNISSGQLFINKQQKNSRVQNVPNIEQRLSAPQNTNNASLSMINITDRPSMRDIQSNRGNSSNKNKQLDERQRSTTKLFQTLKVKLFAQKLLTMSRIGRFNKFKRQQQNLVDDKTTFIQAQAQQKTHIEDGQTSVIMGIQKAQSKYYTTKFSLKGIVQNSQIFTKLLDKLNKIPVISPAGNFKFLWEIVMMIVIVAYLFMIPIEITFNKPLKTLFPYYILLFCNLALIIDFILQWNFGYFEKGLPNMNRIQVMANYFKLQVYLDLTSSFFLVVTFFQAENQVNQFHILFFLRFKNAKLFFKKIEERYNLNPLIKQFSSLIQLLLLIVTVSHIIGCVWISVGHYEDAIGQSSWISDKNVKKDDWISNYIYAYYYSTVTMITVGYGDIRPTNPFEMVVSIMTMLTSCGVFAYSINAIGTIFNSINKKQDEKVNNLFTISQYMAKKNIQFELQIQIKEYLEYYWNMQNARDVEQENNLISQLSPQLKERLLHETFKMIIQDYPIFKQNFSQEFMMSMISVIQECSYRPDEMIISEMIDEDHCIYFIESGKVTLFMDEEGTKVIKYLKKGDMFGDYSFFTGQSINLNIKATEFTSVFKIKRAEFLPLLQKNTQDHEVFCNIQDTLLYQQNYSIINLKCQICSQPHIINKCKQGFPIFNKLRVVNIHNKSEQQNRKLILRRSLNKYPTFVNYNQLFNKLTQFITDQNKEVDLYFYKFISNDDDEDEEDDEDNLVQEGDEPQSSFNIYSQQDISPFDNNKQKEKDKILLSRTLSEQSQKNNLEVPYIYDGEKDSPMVKSPKTQRNRSNLAVGFNINQNNLTTPKNNNNNPNYNIPEQGIINLRKVQSSQNSNQSLNIESPLTKKRNINKIQQIQTNFKNTNPSHHSSFYNSDSLQHQQQNQEIGSPQIRNIDSPLKGGQLKHRFSKQLIKGDTTFQKENIQSTLKALDSNRISELAEHLQQLIGMQRFIHESKDQQVENEYFDRQKNFEFYLPHNNLPYIIEYLKFRERFFKQLKTSQRHNPSIKAQLISLSETQNLENVINQKNAYLYQYPFNAVNCNRSFQIQRVFDKKVQLQKMKKNEKLNRISIAQQFNLSRYKKGKQANTSLQRLLEKYEFVAQQQENSDAASIVNSIPNNNYNSANQSNQIGDNDTEDIPTAKKVMSGQNKNVPHKQSTFFNFYNHSNNNNNNNINNNNNLTSSRNNTSHFEDCTPSSQQFQNYMEKKRRLSTISMTNNNPFLNSFQPDLSRVKLNFNLNASEFPNKETSFNEGQEEEEIVSADRPKFTRIHSTQGIAPKDQYFTEDGDLLNTPKVSSRPTIQQELQLNKIMRNIKSNQIQIPKKKNDNTVANKLDYQ